MKGGSNLERVLSEGKFAVTCELGPPKGADAEEVRELAQLLKGNVDAAMLVSPIPATAVKELATAGEMKFRILNIPSYLADQFVRENTPYVYLPNRQELMGWHIP